MEDLQELQRESQKPHLRFRIGDVLYLNGDLKRKCPLTVSSYIFFEDEKDYVVVFPNSQNKMEKEFLSDKALTL